uniref:Putative sugar 2,3-dehydratase n=1 Tax=Amycolatopsis orientalis subsp. vinearia TaxID=797057 RepID=D7RFL3_AMYOR|nr:putative sugar 2,3-dehydratase [Amycolatopsis orientalis subsp. vinearia]
MLFHDIGQCLDWLAERDRAQDFTVTRTRLDRMPGWAVDPVTGDLAHRSGRFFTVEGLAIGTDHRDVEAWTQPIIVQPEIGILGILTREIGGEPHYLMQAKVEPGNVNGVQLSPTVQATKSNYTRVHQGSPVPYLDHFRSPRRGRVVFDSLQSEQGSWFLSKRNRNMIIEVTEDVPVRPGFCWLTLAQLGELLLADNVVNMDARTVLSGLSFAAGAAPGPARTAELVSWFTEVKARYRLSRTRTPLAALPDWERGPHEIRHRDGRHFSVIGVDVTAGHREVKSWSQPMIAPHGRGVVAFLGRRVAGRLEVLVQARTEAGTHDVVEMAPTVHCIPANYPAGGRPRFLDEVLAAPASARLLDVVHSEEGGRFHHAENRYLVVETEPGADLDVPDDFCWMTPAELAGFVGHGSYVNVGARCLLACLNLAAGPVLDGARPRVAA